MACNDPLDIDLSPSIVRLVLPQGTGETYTTWFNCSIDDENGDPIDLTSATFDGGIKAAYLDAVYLAEVDAEVISAANGTFRFRFLQADIDAITIGEAMTDTASQAVWTFIMDTGDDTVPSRLYRGPVFLVA